jgi:hypothetical protein
LAEQNAKLPEDWRMAFRIGVNLGDLIAEGHTIRGDGGEHRCKTGEACRASERLRPAQCLRSGRRQAQLCVL